MNKVYTRLGWNIIGADVFHNDEIIVMETAC
jgi:hypothetical protein